MPLETPLEKVIPKAEDLLRMPVAALAPILLKLAYQQRQSSGFIPNSISDVGVSDGYPGHKKPQVETHLARTWNWIERSALIEPSPGVNGRNGWRMFTEAGEAVAQGANLDAVRIAQEFPKNLLHPSVTEKCVGLFMSAHYAHAVESSFKVVRDRLRDLTTYERGSEAFGKGRLYVKGAVAPHVDSDFNEGVKFLTMAIDMFRNEKSHTSEIGIDEPTKALQYLVLSSLAMRLLDRAEVRKP